MKTQKTESEKLLEEWIVIKMNDEDQEIRVTHRENFQKMNLCKAYNNYGQECGCYNAGCYSLDNSSSIAMDDLKISISEKFNISLDDIEICDCGNHFEINDFKNDFMLELTDDKVVEINNFIKEWQEENENHTTITGWTYHDSRNFRTIGLKCDNGEPDCVELSDEEQIKILSQMPETAPYMNGFNTSEETGDFIYSFDLWATNPWFCSVERK